MGIDTDMLICYTLVNQWKMDHLEDVFPIINGISMVIFKPAMLVCQQDVASSIPCKTPSNTDSQQLKKLEKHTLLEVINRSGILPTLQTNYLKKNPWSQT